MHVIATAGHVDHGKSALLRALTGMEPDRWAEERRRGMTIDLGYAWMRLASGEQLAFVDVPGHSRFVSNMLAGVGPVPAVLFVVAADGGWMPQSAEHLAAIDALGISRGLLVITRADLADPGWAMAQAKAQIRRSSLGNVQAIAVSAVTGTGLPELVGALGALARSLPPADRRAPVRIWVDRAFSITGSGTVVTGTLPAGTVSRGDELLVTPGLRPVRVRALQSLGENAAELTGVARAALNLRGIDRASVTRGMALIQPGRWTLTRQIDVRICRGGPSDNGPSDRGPAENGRAENGRAENRPSSGDPLPRLITVHVGSARTPARFRMLGSGLARLALRDPLPLHVADRVLLRDPGAARDGAGEQGPALWRGLFGAVVLDVSPPSVSRRGAAAAAAAELASWPDRPTAADLLRRHKLMLAADLAAMGITDQPEPVAGGWVTDPQHWAGLVPRLAGLVAEQAARDPLAAGLPVEVAREALRLPDRRLVLALASAASSLTAAGGVLTLTEQAGTRAPGLPPALATAVASLMADFAARPFDAPEASRLRELGLDKRDLAAAARHGALLRLGEQIVLAPDASERAAQILARLDQPFTAAAARVALGSTRRTVIPLLEYLDRQRVTQRLPDDRRRMRP